MPVARLDSSEWMHAPRMPLGDPYRGHCHVDAAGAVEPTESDQRELCNCGYARNRCARFPAGAADAVRFSVAEDAGGVVRVIWIVESSHSPQAFGSLDYFVDAAEFAGDGRVGASILVTAQARAFVESYLRRRIP
jgi:hypothetical protein